MSPPTAEELNRWDRWFAVECNNHAWDLAGLKPESEDDVLALISCAYASAWHWQRVGTPLNTLRAMQLLTWAHAVGRRKEDAARFAERAHHLAEANATDLSPWDRAFQLLVQQIVGHDEPPQAIVNARDALSPSDQADFDRFREGAQQIVSG